MRDLHISADKIVDCLSDGVYVCDRERRIVYWSKAAERITAPVLMQIADHDRGVPPQAAASAAFKAHAEVRHYPCDHFDIFAGHEWFEPAVKHQISFLTRHLAQTETAEATR